MVVNKINNETSGCRKFIYLFPYSPSITHHVRQRQAARPKQDPPPRLRHPGQIQCAFFSHRKTSVFADGEP